MVEHLSQVNNIGDESDSDGSDTGILPVEFRTALVDNGTRLVMQCKAKEYVSLEEEMDAVNKGKFEKIRGL